MLRRPTAAKQEGGTEYYFSFSIISDNWREKISNQIQRLSGPKGSPRTYSEVSKTFWFSLNQFLRLTSDFTKTSVHKCMKSSKMSFKVSVCGNNAAFFGKPLEILHPETILSGIQQILCNLS